MKQKRTCTHMLIVTGLLFLLVLLGTYSVNAQPTLPAPVSSALNSPLAATDASYSSGWVSINQNETLTLNHNLGITPDDYTVDMWFKDTTGSLGTHRRYYGGAESGGSYYGANWQNFTTNSIQVYRQPGDNVVNQVRVDIRRLTLTSGAYDSGWTTIAAGTTQTFDFSSIAGVQDATDLTVGLFFKSTDLGIHQLGFGGLSDETSAPDEGAYWHNLTTNSVRVTRMVGDPWVEQVRVLVVRSVTPSYDSLSDTTIGSISGWKIIPVGSTFEFQHNLNANPDLLVVRGECTEGALGLGIHQKAAGGDHDTAWRGIYLQKLTSTSVTVAREAADPYCVGVRVVVYDRTIYLYLPLVLR